MLTEPWTTQITSPLSSSSTWSYHIHCSILHLTFHPIFTKYIQQHISNSQNHFLNQIPKPLTTLSSTPNLNLVNLVWNQLPPFIPHLTLLCHTWSWLSPLSPIGIFLLPYNTFEKSIMDTHTDRHCFFLSCLLQLKNSFVCSANLLSKNLLTFHNWRLSRP